MPPTHNVTHAATAPYCNEPSSTIIQNYLLLRDKGIISVKMPKYICKFLQTTGASAIFGK